MIDFPQSLFCQLILCNRGTSNQCVKHVPAKGYKDKASFFLLRRSPRKRIRREFVISQLGTRIENHLAGRLTVQLPILIHMAWLGSRESEALHSPPACLPTNRQSTQATDSKKSVPFAPTARGNMEGPSDCIARHYSPVFSTFPPVIIFLSFPPPSALHYFPCHFSRVDVFCVEELCCIRQELGLITVSFMMKALQLGSRVHS